MCKLDSKSALASRQLMIYWRMLGFQIHCVFPLPLRCQQIQTHQLQVNDGDLIVFDILSGNDDGDW